MTSSDLRFLALVCITAIVPTAQVAALVQTNEKNQQLYRLRLLGLTPLDDVVQFGTTPEVVLRKFERAVRKRFTLPASYYDYEDDENEPEAAAG